MKRSGPPPPYAPPPCVCAPLPSHPPTVDAVHGALSQSALSAYEKLLLAMMVALNPQQKLVTWPLRRLKQITSLSESSVKRALRTLEVRCLLGVYEHWQSDGQPLPTAYQPWLWDLVHQPTLPRFSAVALKQWEGWVKAYEEALEETQKAEEQRIALQQAVAKGKRPRSLKKPKLRDSKYETRPWRLTCTMLDPDGAALSRLANQKMRVPEGGTWRSVEAGPEALKMQVRAFWLNQRRAYPEPKAGVIEPTLCERYWQARAAQAAAAP